MELNLNTKELVKLDDINFDTGEFYKIMEVFKIALRKNSINPGGMQMIYQRKEDATSILAVQVTNGLDNDMSNYMINGCQAWKRGNDVNCDVYLHAEAKSAQKSARLASMITKDIVSFFENVEKELIKKGLYDISMSMMVSLEDTKEKEETGVKKLLKRFFNRTN